MSDNFTHFSNTSSTFLSDYVLSRSTTRSTDVVRMTCTTDFIKVISVVAGISCGKLWFADPTVRAVKGVGLLPLVITAD